MLCFPFSIFISKYEKSLYPYLFNSKNIFRRIANSNNYKNYVISSNVLVQGNGGSQLEQRERAAQQAAGGDGDREK